MVYKKIGGKYFRYMIKMLFSLYMFGCSIFIFILVFIYQYYSYKRAIEEIENRSKLVFCYFIDVQVIKEDKESLYKLSCKLKKEKHLINEYSKNEPTTNLIEVNTIGNVESPFEDNKFVPRHGYFTSSINSILKVKYNSQIDMDELQQYSHLVVVYYCHKVKIDTTFPSKVPHPYLDNKKTGIFSTRFPIRPNPIGITIVQLNSIRDDEENQNIFLDVSNIDMINNTPIISVIPYSSSFIPTDTYSRFNENEIISLIKSNRKIVFSNESESDLHNLKSTFKFYKNPKEIKEAIIDVLKYDQGRRKLNIEYKCQFDSINIYFQYKTTQTILITCIKPNSTTT